MTAGWTPSGPEIAELLKSQPGLRGHAASSGEKEQHGDALIDRSLVFEQDHHQKEDAEDGIHTIRALRGASRIHTSRGKAMHK